MAEDMKGKVVLITGATQGIGLATAKALAPLGATLVLVGRDPQRTAEAVAAVKALQPAQEGASGGVEFLLADLSSMEAVRTLAAQFKSRFQRLDVLVNNAGGVFTKRELTVDGFERTFALNHLSYFLLTTLLLDVLKASAPSRIINVSSDAASGGRLNFDDVMGERKYRGFVAYCHSKLANMFFTQELARRLESSGVTVNAVHPGVVASGFGRNTPGFLKWGLSLVGGFMLTPEKGAGTSVFLATSPTVQGVTGKYFKKSKVATWPRPARNDEARARLWTLSEQLTGTRA